MVSDKSRDPFRQRPGNQPAASQPAAAPKVEGDERPRITDEDDRREAQEEFLNALSPFRTLFRILFNRRVLVLISAFVIYVLGLLGVDCESGGSSHSAGLSEGLNHTCVVEADGSVACWGDNSYGQASPPAGQFISISAALWHTCAVRADGSAACWGYKHPGEASLP